MDATIAGMRPDPRVRQPQLREIMELYRDVAHRKQGAIVFLAGEPGCGRSATLAALGEALRAEKDKPFIVSGVIAAGQYTPLRARKRISSAVSFPRKRESRHNRWTPASAGVTGAGSNTFTDS